MATRESADRIHRSIDRTPEDRARIAATRARLQAERPGLEELVESGEYAEPMPLGLYQGLAELMAKLRQSREKAGLSLSQVAERSGIDKGALSRLETGHNANPTFETLGRYAAAVGQQITMDVSPATA